MCRVIWRLFSSNTDDEVAKNGGDLMLCFRHLSVYYRT